ncbi:MAG: cation:proton antiporter, partial [Spirochaetia bacterium]|nr:cation:proton antiporter [Spirochaetia bacterium]
MAHPDIIRLLIALGILLASARILGEIAVKLKQPMFLGEILAGLLLGPSLLGHFSPEWQTLLFPPTGPVASTLEGFFTIAIVFFMLVAGMELDLRLLRREGKIASAVGLLGIFVPFLVGFFLAWGFPGFFGNSPAGRHPLIFP